MRRPRNHNTKILKEIQASYVQKNLKIIFVKADKRPWRELKEGERWALDVERTENAAHVQEEYIGHWRVTAEPNDIGRRPKFDVPVRYFYFIHEERPPGEQEWEYDPEKASNF